MYYGIIDTLAMVGGAAGPAPWGHLARDYPRRMLIAFASRMFVQLNGIRAILHFLPERLAQAGFPVQRTLFSAGCCSLLYGLGTLPVIAFLDRIGRRRSLLLGSAGLTLTLALVAAPQLTVDVNHHFRSMHLLARGVATGMGAYLFCFSATWGTVPRLLSAELFPLYMRARDRPRRRGRLARVFVETGGQELEGIAGVFGDALPPPQKIKQEDKVLRVHRRHGKGRSAVGLASQATAVHSAGGASRSQVTLAVEPGAEKEPDKEETPRGTEHA
ncbi:hypothetical protein DFH09DRAFT_156721 [Mycena vulgaris]|nr:hypothetical protein DFH09DRAFT_156721 [Mycena vulgaris]